MHDYDRVVKIILKDRRSRLLLGAISGMPHLRWLPVGFEKTQSTAERQADLVGRAPDRTLVHVELQSTNDPKMALRMAEYYLSIYRRHKKFPRQFVLYLGQKPMRMKTTLGPHDQFSYTLIDVRQLDGEDLLESPNLGDNIFAILARLRDRKAAVRRVLTKIAKLAPAERGGALMELMILSGLRKMGKEIEEEAKRMPILDDIMDHEVLGREYKKGHKEGKAEGQAEGEAVGERNLFRRQLEKRFGPLPELAQQQLATCSTAQVETLNDALFSGATLEEILTRLRD